MILKLLDDVRGRVSAADALSVTRDRLVLDVRDGDVTELYKVAQFPTTLLVDRDGVVRERIIGVIPRLQWEALIEKWD